MRNCSIERLADLKLTLRRGSKRRNCTTLGEEDDSRSRQLAQDADLVCMIVCNVFLIPWTYAYQSNVFYHGHNSMLVKTQSICWVVANNPCLVLLFYLGGFLSSRALIGYPLGNLF